MRLNRGEIHRHGRSRPRLRVGRDDQRQAHADITGCTGDGLVVGKATIA
jgi:hypothetical protein